MPFSILIVRQRIDKQLIENGESQYNVEKNTSFGNRLTMNSDSAI